MYLNSCSLGLFPLSLSGETARLESVMHHVMSPDVAFTMSTAVSQGYDYNVLIRVTGSLYEPPHTCSVT